MDRLNLFHHLVFGIAGESHLDVKLIYIYSG